MKHEGYAAPSPGFPVVRAARQPCINATTTTALHCTAPSRRSVTSKHTSQDSSFVVCAGRALYTLSPHALCARTRDRHGHRDLQSRTAAESCLLVPVLLILADGSSGEPTCTWAGVVDWRSSHRGRVFGASYATLQSGRSPELFRALDTNVIETVQSEDAVPP